MVNYHQKRVRENYLYFVVMENGPFPFMLHSEVIPEWLYETLQPHQIVASR